MRHSFAAFSLFAAGCAGAATAHAPYALQRGHIDLASGPDGNTVILDTPEGLVVIDTGRHAAHAEAILEHAGRVGKPVIAVVNTHWHLDHTTGNRDVLSAYPGARLIATSAMSGALAGFLAPGLDRARQRAADLSLPEEERARAARSLAALEDRAAMVPAEPIDRSGAVSLGGRSFDLRVAGRAATEADLWLLAPDEGLAVVGDLVVAQVPFFDTACEEGWREALAAIDAAEWSVLIPGHGAPMGREDYARWRSAFENWVDCAASDSSAATCAEGWMADAEGFYTDAEAESVRLLAEAYVTEILRAPADQRQGYCRV